MIAEGLVALVINVSTPRPNLIRNEIVNSHNVTVKKQSVEKSTVLAGDISWHKAKPSEKEYTTACWNEYKKGTKFKVTFDGKSLIVTCTDYGRFRSMGRVLDLSSRSFEYFKPLGVGIIRGAKTEVMQ